MSKKVILFETILKLFNNGAPDNFIGNYAKRFEFNKSSFNFRIFENCA